MSFLNLMIELNAFNMVLTLNDCQQSFTYVGSIIGDYISFNVYFCSLSFLHIMREANQTAHYLAKCALYNLYCIWIKETPLRLVFLQS
jgi:hypothetical protein